MRRCRPSGVSPRSDDRSDSARHRLAAPERPPKQKSQPLEARLLSYFDGDDSVVPVLAREYQVEPDDMASFDSPDAFVQFLASLLHIEEGDRIVSVVETLLIIFDVDAFDLGLFAQPDMLSKFVDLLPPAEFPVSFQMICVDVISRFLSRAPDTFPVLCALDYPARLLALITQAPMFPGADDQTDVFVNDVGMLCYAVDTLLSHPASGEIGAVLWAMGFGLIAIDDSRAKRPG